MRWRGDRKLGRESNGGVPVSALDEPTQSVDVGIDVIEDPGQRVVALADFRLHPARLHTHPRAESLRLSSHIRWMRDHRPRKFQKIFDAADIQASSKTPHTETVPVDLGINLVFCDAPELHDFLGPRAGRFIDGESIMRRTGIHCMEVRARSIQHPSRTARCVSASDAFGMLAGQV